MKVVCWKAHNRDNPKEKHLWTQESSVSPFEVILMCYMSWIISCSICHVQPPQQVALTEFNSQVNAPVGPILLTCSEQSSLLVSFSLVQVRPPGIVYLSLCVSPSSSGLWFLQSFAHLKWWIQLFPENPAFFRDNGKSTIQLFIFDEQRDDRHFKNMHAICSCWVDN